MKMQDLICRQLNQIQIKNIEDRPFQRHFPLLT